MRARRDGGAERRAGGPETIQGSRKAALEGGARSGRPGIGVGDDPGPTGPGQPTHDQDAELGLVAPVRAKRWRNFSTRPVSLMRCWAPV